MRGVTPEGETLLYIGSDYRRSLASEREALASSAATFHQWIARHRSKAIREGFVVSTCHRVEFYVATGDQSRAVAELREFARAETGRDVLNPRRPLLHLTGTAALRHLCRVTSGLESLVLGEYEISGQVRRAASDARSVGALGPILGTAIGAALTSSRRVRAETALSRGSASLAGLAVQALARDGVLPGARILVIGAGAVSREAARRLVRHHPRQMVIASRSSEHAHRLAADVGGRVQALDSVPQVLDGFDVCVAAISAADWRLTSSTLPLGDRRDRRLDIADLSLPRTFASSVGQLPGVRLLTVDDLGPEAEGVRARRLAAVPEAESIVNEEVSRAIASLTRAGADRYEAIA